VYSRELVGGVDFDEGDTGGGVDAGREAHDEREIIESGIRIGVVESE